MTKTTNGLILKERTDMANNPAAVFLDSYIPSTRAQYTHQLKAVANVLGADDMFDVDWAAIRFRDTQMIKNKLMNMVSGSTDRPLSSASVNLRLAALRGVLKTAWRMDLINADDYLKAVDVKDIKSTKLPAGRELSVEEIQDLLTACTDDPSPAGIRDAAIISVLYGTGLRRGEIVRLSLDDYDSDNGQLIVNGKGNKQRIAYLLNGTEYALEDWLDVRGDESGALFLAITKYGRIKKGRRLSGTTIYSLLQKRRVEAGVEFFSPHSLRRTFVSHLLDAGADLSTVSKLAGHSSVAMTALYDRRGESAKIEAANMLSIPYSGRNK